MKIQIDPLEGIVNRGDYTLIQQCMKKAMAGEAITTAFLGGSITMGSLSSTSESCYAYLVYRWWCETFPNSKVTFVNAGIGGTTSQFGAARVEEDVLSYRPDFVLTEFAVNDENTEFYKETYESLIRRILLFEKRPALLTMCNVCYDSGASAEEMHLAVAKHYRLPMVSMKSSIYKEVTAGHIDRSEITPDNLHPNDRGHRLVADVIIRMLQEILADLQSKEIADCVTFDIPAPLTPASYETAVRYQNYNSDEKVSFGVSAFSSDRAPQENICDIFRKGWTAWHEGAYLTITVPCTELAVQYRKSVRKPTCIAQAVIDDDKEHAVILDGNFTEDWGDCLAITTVGHHLPYGLHRITITVIESHEADVVPFYLTSVIASSRK